MLRNRSAWILGGGLLSVVALYLWLNWEPAIPIPSHATAPAPGQPESIPGGQQTPEYDRLQRLADDQRLREAQRQGGSAMPTPPTLDDLLVSTQAPTPAPEARAPETPPPSRVPASASTGPMVTASDGQYAAALERQIKELIKYRDTRFAPPPTQMMTYTDVKAQQAAVTAAQAPPPSSVQPAAYRAAPGRGVPNDLDLRPGDILHAVLQTAINSDEPGPVRARVVGERFKDAILLGSLAPFSPVVGNRPERVLVRFQYLTDRDRVYDLDAYAIDPSTTRTALADNVNHHYFSRWGALIAASFLEGYGNAVRASNRNTTIGLFGNVITTPKDDIDDTEIAKEALGTVGERLSDAVGQHFSRPNTITVDSGAAIGVLILSPSSAPTTPDASRQAAAEATESQALAIRPRYSTSPYSERGMPPLSDTTPPALPQ